jgi:hypothetical protein
VDGRAQRPGRDQPQGDEAGDLCFFYHSNEGKEIVGIAKVTKTAYLDPTDKAGKAVTVDVAPVEPVKQPVTLAAIKADPKFKEMGLVRQSRLSVVAGQRRALETHFEDGRRFEVTDNTRGILWMSASVVVFIFNDALIKLAAETAPAVQVIGLRGVFATLWCLLVLLATGGWRHVKDDRPSRRVRARPARSGGGAHLSRRALAHAVRHRHRRQSFDAVLPGGARGRDPEGGRALAALDGDRGGLRGRADGDPAQARRRQRLDVAGGGRLVCSARSATCSAATCPRTCRRR